MNDSGKLSSIRNIVERNSKTVEVQQRVLAAAEQGEVVDFEDFCYLCSVEGGEYVAPVASLALDTVLPAAENVSVDYHCRGRFEYGTHRAEIFERDGAPCIRILPNDKAVSSLCLGVGQFEYLLDTVAKYDILRERFGMNPSKADCRKHGYEICSMMNSKGAERMSRQKNGKKLLAKSAAHTMRRVSLTGCDVQAAEYDDVALGSYTGSVCYSQLITDDSFAAGYDAMVDIMASGENPDTQEGTGWYDGDFEYEDLEMDMLNYACYDNPLYSMYRTGADNGVGMSVNTETGDVRIFSNATEQGDDFNAMYNEVDAIATNMVNQALAEADGSTAVYIQSLLQQLADSIEYSNDPSSAHTNDIYGALVNRSSRCYGYASAMKYMLDMQEIPNFIATGEMGGDRHAWNMVDMGGTWVVVDATASVGMMTAEGVSSLEDCQSPYYYCLRTLDTINKNTDNPYYLEDETIELLKM